MLALRLSGFYIAIFCVIGCMLPFWPVWLQSRGMGGVEIGILTAIPVLGKLVFSPIFASYVDRLGERKRPMLFFLSASLVTFVAFAFVDGFVALLIVSVFYGMCWAPIMSFGDNITLLSTRATNIQYGRLRLWGSLSFIVMSFGFGWVLEHRGESSIYWTIVVAIAATLVMTTLLPDVRVKPLGRGGQPVRRLIKNKTFLIFMGCVAFIHGSHALYYAFATLHWRSLGYSDSLIGFLWAEAVIAEVIFFIFGGRLGARFSAAALLLCAALACVVRWSVLVFDPVISILLIVQTLHALTFGAMHLGAMNFMSRAVSLDLSATAQSLYGASAFGLGAGVTLLFVGGLYEALGASAFFIMTLMGIGGTIFALALRRSEELAEQIT